MTTFDSLLPSPKRSILHRLDTKVTQEIHHNVLSPSIEREIRTCDCNIVSISPRSCSYHKFVGVLFSFFVSKIVFQPLFPIS